MTFHPRSKIDAAGIVLLLWLTPGTSLGEPLRLRGDALVETRAPVGLVVLEGRDQAKPWLDVETVTWVGSGGSGDTTPTGDVLTLSVRARDPKSGSEVRGGRMIVSSGAIRPVQIDGVRGLARFAEGTSVETFGGIPVVRRFGYTTFDWTAGGRVGQAISDKASFGGSYVLQRRGGETANEEAGADVALTPSPRFTAAGRAAFDVVTRGLTDALASIGTQKEDVRGELFVTHRSPGRLLPATSLFSVLGDFAATSSGGTVRWRAFPRLELLTTGSVQVQGRDVGGQGLARTTLALDDAWRGSLGLELRRVDFDGVRWAGARAIASLPLGARFHLATELEAVRPDRPRGRGALWPWALGALAFTPNERWEIAAAVEGRSGPVDGSGVTALARLAFNLERSRP